LAEFLEGQRAAFPRFFFLGDEDMLELLGGSNGGGAGAAASGIQRHLPRLFAGVAGLRVTSSNEGPDSNGSSVAALVSPEGEELPLVVPAGGVPIVSGRPLHEWLSALTASMQASLLASVHECASLLPGFSAAASASAATKGTSTAGVAADRAYALALQAVFRRCSVGAVLLASRVRWTAAIESAMQSKDTAVGASLAAVLTAVTESLLAFTDQRPVGTMGAEQDAGASAGSSALARRKGESVIVDLVHCRDVTRALVSLASGKQHALSASDYEWTSRLRAYIPPSPQQQKQGHSHAQAPLHLRMGEASFAHGLEYLGVCERLVQTPLTDRCAVRGQPTARLPFCPPLPFCCRRPPPLQVLPRADTRAAPAPWRLPLRACRHGQDGDG
jgi:dynein heavy chain 1, cytosolic